MDYYSFKTSKRKHNGKCMLHAHAYASPNFIYQKSFTTMVQSVFLRLNDPDRCNFIHKLHIYFYVIIKTNNYDEKLWSTRTCMFHSQNLIGPNAYELHVPVIFNYWNEVLSRYMFFFFNSSGHMELRRCGSIKLSISYFH